MPTYKDEKGQWYCKFYYTDWKGISKQKMKRGFARQKDAKLWESAFISKEKSDEKTTYRTVAEIYLAENKPRWRATTYISKNSSLNNHIMPYFADMALCDTSERNVVEWQNEMLGKGLSVSYLHKVDRIFREIFKFGAKRCKLKDIPFSELNKIGKGDVRSLNFWTHEEYKRFISCVTDPTIHVAFQTLFYTGIRIGELRALMVGDVDLKTNILTISKSLKRLHKKDIVTEPKTTSGIRKISMPVFLCTELESYFKKLYNVSGETRIFTFSDEPLRYAMKKYSLMAEVDRIRIHDLRHSHVAMLIEKGIQPLVIAERLGHANVNITLGTYAHLYPNKQNEIADMLDFENNSIKTVSS